MATVTLAPVAPPWEENADQYKCCCQKCHIMTGTKIIGIVEAVMFALSFMQSLHTVINGKDLKNNSSLAATSSEAEFLKSFGLEGSNSNAAAEEIIWSVIWAVVLFCLFWGLNTKKASFILPHLVMQVISMIIIGILALIIVVVGVYRRIAAPFIILALIILGLGMGLEVWFFFVVRACYRYLKEYNIHQSYQMNARFTGVMPHPAIPESVLVYPGQMPTGSYPMPQHQPPPYEFKQKIED